MAVTTVFSTNGPDVVPVGQHVVYDFEGAPPAGLSGDGYLVSGSLKNVYAAPYLDKTQYLATPGLGLTTLSLTSATGALSFYWGSIDDFNRVRFFDGDGNLVSAFKGKDIPLAPSDGSIGNPVNNRRVLFDFGGDLVKTVVFTSDRNAFEIDDFAVAFVPEPATWGLLLVGFAMIGASMRRRKGVYAA